MPVGSRSAATDDQTNFPTPGLVKARNALLDALIVLGAQKDSLVVIGAQAVHERTSSLRLQATSTEDGDFAVAPELLLSAPIIGESMSAAGYVLKNPDRPGIWCRPGHESESIDLLVPKAFSGNGRRAARVALPQGKNALGIAEGIELAVVDNDVMFLESFDRSQPGTVVKVAGPAALICAKSFKLAERVRDAEAGRRDRVRPKDAGDIVRVLLTYAPDCLEHAVASVDAVGGEHGKMVKAAAEKGVSYFQALFGPGGRGRSLAVDDLGRAMERQVFEACDAWTAAGR